MADNAMVYVTTTNDYLYALSAVDGSVVWRFHGDDAQHPGGPPTIANGVVYFGAYDGCETASATHPYLYAVSAATGALIWRVSSIALAGKLLVANGVIYGGSCEDQLAAYRASDGASLWTRLVGGGCFTGALAGDANNLYLNEFACFGVVAVRVADGGAAWQQSLGDGGAPTLVNGVLYVGHAALRTSDGSILRTFQVTGAVQATDAVTDGVVYVPNIPYLSAWNTTTGAQIWQIAPKGPHTSIFGVGNGAIVTGDGHNVTAYHASDGTQLWSAVVENSVVPLFDPLPASLGSTLYLGTFTGAIVALRASDGTAVWRTTLQ